MDRITVKGFRSIARIEDLRLGPINILIGPHGSGKTNCIGVFPFLHAVRTGNLSNYVARAGGADRILHFGSQNTKVIIIQISFQDKGGPYRIELAPNAQDGLFPLRESGSLPEKQIPDCYHFHDTGATSPMKKIANLNDNRWLRPDGANLAPFLFLLREKHRKSYDWIRRTIRLTAPFFDDFQLAPTQRNEDKIRLEWAHRGSDAWFDASSLSDGTLRFIALATLLLQPPPLRPSVIIIDEPELGLHPHAITLLASLVKQASVETQIILATQSSLLLDHFRPEDVLVANRVNRATRLDRLQAEPLREWLRDFSLGQLWEKNEFGGRPVPET